MKTCSKCKVTKELTEFTKRGDYDQYRSHCKKCNNLANNIRHKKRYPNRRKPAAPPEIQRQRRLKSMRKHNAKRRAYNAAISAIRHATKLNATPKWLTSYQKESIFITYALARLLSETFGVPMQVDHIVPLRGKNVCGLHVPWNFQIMHRDANMQKSNKYE